MMKHALSLLVLIAGLLIAPSSAPSGRLVDARSLGVTTAFAQIGPIFNPMVFNRGVQIAWSRTLASETSGWGTYSLRQQHLNILAAGTQVRVRIKAPLTGSSVVNNFSIGVQSSTYNTVATPIELKINGASGFTIAAGAADIISDWATLATTTGQTLISVVDNGAVSTLAAAISPNGDGIYYLVAAASYNQASPGGVWTNSTLYTSTITTIEVR